MKSVKLIAPGTKITSRALMTFMGVNCYMISTLVIKKLRKISIQIKDKKPKKRLVRLC